MPKIFRWPNKPSSSSLKHIHVNRTDNKNSKKSSGLSSILEISGKKSYADSAKKFTANNPGINHDILLAQTNKLSLKKLTVAPIRVISALEIIKASENMLQKLSEDWKEVKSSRFKTYFSNMIKNRSASNTPQKEAWNQRINDTREVLNSIQKKDLTKFTHFGYFVDEQPIGLITLLRASPPVIIDLVTHPGSEGAGSALVEQAVNQSLEWGEKGKLILFPLGGSTGAARKAYEAFGFTYSSPYMKMDPSNSEKWAQKSGAWYLKKYNPENYIG